VDDLVVVAHRLPVESREECDGSTSWHPSPGGLVSALAPIVTSRGGPWIGWSGVAGDASVPFRAQGMDLVPVPLSQEEIELHYEGMCNATLWPLYHDVIAAPEFHRAWWDAYIRVNRRFATVAAQRAAPGALVWVQDYQLQLVPRMLRELRPDLRIGYFHHIPFPPYEIFAQLPWRRQVLDGLTGADLLGFQRQADANNLMRAARRSCFATIRGSVVVPGSDLTRNVGVAAFPISVDAAGLDEVARSPAVLARAREIRLELGDPEVVLLAVERLDYTKGSLHRLKAFAELLDDGRVRSPGTVFVQVSTPSRERVSSYQAVRAEVEVAVGRVNGVHGQLGRPVVHYLHQSFPREELVALYLAADVLLVTALRDGMNLVAKEYVACRFDESGALVLSEFAGAAAELPQAYLVNPHDIDQLKDVIDQAVRAAPRELSRRMRAMRRRVFQYDVGRWAANYLTRLERASPEIVLGDAPPT
jgi:alpha,alpha-trehalose-phosphate synthase [UDP-forming]